MPSKVIKPSKFTDIMVDLRLAESNMKQLNQNHYRYNNLIDSSYQLVYYLHNVTADKYEESLQFYIDHPEWMEKISNEVTEKLNQLTE